MKKYLSLLIVISLLVFITTACPDGPGPDPRKDTTITTSAIQGVSTPLTFTTPVSSIRPDIQFTGTVTWAPPPVDNKFQPNVQYTATIRINPRAGYTLEGVRANFFTVQGDPRPTTTNAANSGTVTARFPATGGTTINITSLTGILPPVAGAEPTREVDNRQYKIKITWLPEVPAGGKFADNTVYTAMATLEALPGLDFSIVSDVTVSEADSVSYNAGSGVFTIVFPAAIVGEGYIVTPDVTHYRQPTVGSAETSKLSFQFADNRNLTAANITITSGTGAATKGNLTGSGKNWVLEVEDVKTGTINIVINGVPGVSVTPRTVEVYGEQDLRDILEAMTRQQRASQMVQADCNNGRADGAGSIEWGSILSNAGNRPGGDNSADTTAWVNRLNGIAQRSVKINVNGAETLVPAIYGIDAVHGHAMKLHAIVLPMQVGIGAIYTGDKAKGLAAAYDSGRITAEEMLATNVRWTFSPCAGVAENMRWGRAYECYGSDVETVTELIYQNVKGMQDIGVAPTLKHFIGEGQVVGDNPNRNSGNRNNNPITHERIMEIAGVYRKSIEAWSIMPSYLGLNITGSGTGVGNHIMHGHKPMINDYWKEEMQWNGMVVGDYQCHSVTDRGGPGTAPTVIAGVDCLMAAEKSDASLRSNERDQILNGCSDERINDAVMRILRLKKRVGLFDNPVIEPGQLRKPANVAAARAVAADSMVLLRNKNDLIQKIQDREFKSILVAGRASEGNTGRGFQCGAWTTGWVNGPLGTNAVTAITISEGINEAKGSDITVSTSPDGSMGGTYDLIIAVISEQTYAESTGDIPADWARGGLILGPDMTMLNNVYAKQTANPSTKILTVILSGRPIAFTSITANGNNATNAVGNQEYLKWDGLIAAWLPGDQAGGALADLLFTEREFVGKTPHPWHAGIDKVGPEVYPYGHGLRKSDPIDTNVFEP